MPPLNSPRSSWKKEDSLDKQEGPARQLWLPVWWHKSGKESVRNPGDLYGWLLSLSCLSINVNGKVATPSEGPHWAVMRHSDLPRWQLRWQNPEWIVEEERGHCNSEINWSPWGWSFFQEPSSSTFPLGNEDLRGAGGSTCI
jgi:hypothetical protein